MGFIARYFKHTEKYPTWRYVAEMTLVAFILKIISSIFFGTILDILNIHLHQDLNFEVSQVNSGLIWVAISVPIFAAFETVVGQWMVLTIAAKFTKKMWIRILASTVIFTSLHVDPDLMIAVLPVGAILAYTFAHFRKESFKKAFWVTTSIHSLHNYVALLLVWLSLR